MSEEAKLKLRKERGTSIYMYILNPILTLIHIFDSKQFLYNSINLHHTTLTNCLNTGALYLNTFLFSEDFIIECTNFNISNITDINVLLNQLRNLHHIKKHPSSLSILAEGNSRFTRFTHINQPELTKVYYSLSSLARDIKGDRVTIRKYLNGQLSGYYKGVWKFTYLNSKSSSSSPS